jgi:hypothetical protein
MTKAGWANQDLVIFLDPHPDAKLLDHDLKSPTFRESIKDTIDEYLGIKKESE